MPCLDCSSLAVAWACHSALALVLVLACQPCLGQVSAVFVDHTQAAFVHEHQAYYTLAAAVDACLVAAHGQDHHTAPLDPEPMSVAWQKALPADHTVDMVAVMETGQAWHAHKVLPVGRSAKGDLGHADFERQALDPGRDQPALALDCPAHEVKLTVRGGHFLVCGQLALWVHLAAGKLLKTGRMGWAWMGGRMMELCRWKWEDIDAPESNEARWAHLVTD